MNLGQTQNLRHSQAFIYIKYLSHFLLYLRILKSLYPAWRCLVLSLDKVPSSCPKPIAFLSLFLRRAKIRKE